MDSAWKQVVQDAWKKDEEGRRIPFGQRLRITACSLKKWNRESFGFCQAKIQELQYQLEDIQGLPTTDFNLTKEREIQGLLNECYMIQELL